MGPATEAPPAPVDEETEGQEPEAPEEEQDEQPENPADPDPAGQELAIEGSGQLSFSVGGKRPTTSSVRLLGGKVDVAGQFEKGETIVLRVEATVGEVAFVDDTDSKTGQVVGSERRHRARITGVGRL